VTRRREFIILFGGAAAWPLAARAQQPEPMRRIGVLMGAANDSEGQARARTLEQALDRFGWVRGRNVHIDYRWDARDNPLELIPSAALIGVLVDPTFTEASAQLTQLQTAARVIGKQVHVLNASTQNEIDTAFASISSFHIDALLIGATPFFRGRRNQIAALAARHAIPTSAEGRDFAEGGLLMSYGPIITDIYLQVGGYTGRILKGEKPADLPVVQPSKFELVINLKTAKTLGLSIPDKLLALADEVIE
jgi:ABC transporter substrate binding protein